MTSTRLYDQACIASEKANTLRLQAARLSVPDELYWYNNHTNWESLDRKEFRGVMLRMETITIKFYNNYGECMYPQRSAAIKKFWADEWGCEYLPESGRWLDLATGTFIESETEQKALKKAKKEAKKAAKNAKKAAKNAKKEAKKAAKNVKQTAQYNDEEEELYAQAALQTQQQQQQQTQTQTQQQQQAYEYDDWYDAEEEAYAEAYAKARAQEELKEQQQAQLYLDYTSEEEEEEEEEEEPLSRIACQPVLYIEELTHVQGDPDWRAYIYYDARIRRYVLKGTRRSLRATTRKTRYPEVKLCFRSSRELARYLRSSTDATMNVTMFAMAGATARDATFAELYALPFHGCKTELFGYDDTRPCYSTFVDYLRTLSNVDAAHSNFAAF